MNRALAIAAHPDDIELGMAGTLLLLADAGWEIHCMNLSSGDLGSMTLTSTEIAAVRKREAQAAATALGATWHAPIADDLRIFYDELTLRRLCGVIREVAPSVILTHSPQDYMEDHETTSRLAVTAAFARGMPNFLTLPELPALSSPVTLYHALPHGLHDGLGRRIIPGAFVDTTTTHERKRAALACHASQKEWLDATQGMNSYLVAMDEFSEEVGRLSGKFQHAEGWRRHSHLGFCDAQTDPLRAALGDHFLINPDYEKSLKSFMP